MFCAYYIILVTANASSCQPEFTKQMNPDTDLPAMCFNIWRFLHQRYCPVLQILESDKRITLGQNDTGFNCDGTANTFRVMFKEPVEILPNVSYTACATLKVSLNLQ